MTELILLAQVTTSPLVNLLVQVVVVGLICWLLWWFIGWVALPEPFNKVARVIIALVGVIFLINVLLKISGNNGFF